jgi:hypothetical protein
MIDAAGFSNRVKGLETMLALVRAKAGAGQSGALGPVLVFRPGGVAGGNVYTDWALLMAAAAVRAGHKTIEIDTSLGAANVPAGAWNLDDVTLVPRVPAGTGATTLTFEQGATITYELLEVRGPLQLVQASSVVVATAQENSLLLLLYGANIKVQPAAAPFLEVTAAEVAAQIVALAAGIGQNNNPVIQVDAGAICTIHAYDQAGIHSDALSGGGTAIVFYDASSAPGAPQTVATLTLTPVDLAADVGYTPAVPGNWQPAPATIAAAADQLAAPNFVQALALAGPAAATQIITTGNIARKRSGYVRVVAQQSLLTSAQDLVIFTLQRDGVNIAGAPTIEATSAGANDYVTASIAFIDQLPDDLSHTYSILATHTAANLTQDANSGAISVEEL